MRTKGTTREKNEIETLTEEIKNLRIELRVSNESVKTLSKTVKALRENCEILGSCEYKQFIRKRKSGKAPFSEGDRVRITNRIKQHIDVATVGDRVSTVTGVSLNREKGYRNKIFITTDNGFETWRDPSNLTLL